MKKCISWHTFALLVFMLISNFSNANNLDAPSDSSLLKLEVEGVYGYGGGALVRLNEEGDTNWVMSMVIGECEAIGILRSTEGVDFSRPLTYDLFISIFDKTSLEIQYVVISKLDEGVFYAELYIKDGDKIVIIDSRPSDSINIALKTSVPIYCNHDVWKRNKEKMD